MDRYEETFRVWNKLAALYESKFMYFDLYNDTYDDLCNMIAPPGARVLEIACGPGNITRYLLDKRPDLKIEAIDIAPDMIQLAKKNNPEASFELMDCRDIAKLNGPFDAIVCGFCMPYLSPEDVARLVADVAGLLNKNGIFYGSTIADKYERSGYETSSSGDRVFVYYHEQEFLEAELTKSGFEVKRIYHKPYDKIGKEPDVHLVFIAIKKN